MSSLQIKILNPKARKLLKDLADLELISIIEIKKPTKDLKSLLFRLRSKSSEAPILDEIVREVKNYRSSKNG